MPRMGWLIRRTLSVSFNHKVFLLKKKKQPKGTTKKKERKKNHTTCMRSAKALCGLQSYNFHSAKRLNLLPFGQPQLTKEVPKWPYYSLKSTPSA